MLAVEAALSAESSGLRLRINGEGRSLTCRVEGDLARVFTLLRQSGQFLAALRVAIPIVVQTGISVELFAGHVHVGRIGRGVKQNALGRLLGLPSTRLGR